MWLHVDVVLYMHMWNIWIIVMFKYWVQWVNCPHSKLLILHWHFICFRLSAVQQTNQLGIFHEESSTITKFTCLKISKRHAWHSCWKIQYEDFRVFRCQSNNRIIFTLLKTKYPVQMIALWMVTSNGNVLPPFIFPNGLKLNIKAYTKSLEKEVPLWIKRVAARRPFIWQQDCTMPHKQKNLVWAVRKFLWAYLPNIWLPNSLIAILLIIVCGLCLSERQAKLHTAPKMNWKQE